MSLFRLALKMAFGDRVVAVVTYPTGIVREYESDDYAFLQGTGKIPDDAKVRLVERDVLIAERALVRVQ